MQQNIFTASDFPSSQKYKRVFSFMPCSPFEEGRKSTGRPPYSPDALLKALIYGGLRRFTTLSEICFELTNNMHIAEDLGFNILKSLPTIERFSAFLQDTDNNLLQSLRNKLVHCLMDAGLITGHILSIDCCPIIAPIRENNLKTMVKERFNKISQGRSRISIRSNHSFSSTW